jgi:hypothetical protein
MSPHPSSSSSFAVAPPPAAFGDGGGESHLDAAADAADADAPPYPPRDFAGVVSRLAVGVYDSPYNRGGGAADENAFADMSTPRAAASSSALFSRDL